jgi:hypothetical protein
MAELIAVGTTASAYFDVTVASGATKALFIKTGTANQTPNAGVKYEIAYKVGTSDYEPFDQLTPANIKDKGLIVAPGTFGLRRLDTGDSSGMNVEG